MIKGAQKRMIILHTADSRIFEEAFFVLKETDREPQPNDILAEANRILEDCLKGSEPKQEKKPPCRRFFAIGTLVGFGVSLLLFFLFR